MTNICPFKYFSCAFNTLCVFFRNINYDKECLTFIYIKNKQLRYIYVALWCSLIHSRSSRTVGVGLNKDRLER